METAQADLKDARILLVDDTPANLNVLCELLEARGCRISMAPNGTVALRLALEAQPDLILLDVVMPDMDGLGYPFKWTYFWWPFLHGRSAVGRSKLAGRPRWVGGTGRVFPGRRLAMRSW